MATAAETGRLHPGPALGQAAGALTRLAERWAASAAWRHASYLAAALAAISLIGYHVGTFDQSIHLPFLKQAADSGLYPGDAFLALRAQHTSYFWLLFLPVYRAGLLEPAMFAAHLLATYLTFWAAATLSETLGGRPLGRLLTVIVLVFPHVGLRGSPLLEFSLLNRTFVLPFLIWALVLYLRGRTWPAFALLGGLYNLHAISVSFALAMLVWDHLLTLRRRGWRSLAGGLALFGAAAAPVLLWRSAAAPLDLSVRWEWFTVLTQSLFAHMFYMLAPQVHVLITSLCGASVFAIFWLARREGLAPAPQPAVTHFVTAALIVLGVEAVTAQWLPVTAIIELQIIRVTQLVLLLAYVTAAHWLAVRYEAGQLRGTDLGALAGVLLAAPLPLIPLWVGGVWRVLAPARRAALAGGLGAILSAGALGLFAGYGAWSPGIHIWPVETAWYRAQAWARENTPREAVFITPPQRWGFFEPEWRVFSERSTVASLSEVLEMAFAPDYLAVWRPRFEAVAPGALARFRGDFFQNQQITAAAFYRLTPAELRALARRYHADYLVLEKPHSFPGRPLYENEAFVIYALPPESAGGRPEGRP